VEAVVLMVMEEARRLCLTNQLVGCSVTNTPIFCINNCYTKQKLSRKRTYALIKLWTRGCFDTN